MRLNRIGLVAGLLLMAQLAGTSCILIPKIEKRSVLLVVSRAENLPVHAQGATNRYTGTATVNLRDSLDFAQIISDAGIDASKIQSVVIGKIEYRVAVADPTPSRALSNTTVKVAVGGGAPTDLLTGLSYAAGAVTPWKSAPLNAAGVTQLNNLLAAVVAELQGGPTANESLTYSIAGDSTPIDIGTDFWYEIRLTLLVTGKVETNVIN